MSLIDTLITLADGTFERFRRRVQGLTDAEFFWEPVANCWSVRASAGRNRVDGGFVPEEEPAPVTTIAWRMAHIGRDCLLGWAHREWPQTVPHPASIEVPGNVSEAMALCELGHRSWRDNFAALGADGIVREARSLRGTPYGGSDVVGLHLHVYDEVIHHAAEVGLLRDLYRAGFRADVDGR
jgi:hypothetical protein